MAKRYEGLRWASMHDEWQETNYLARQAELLIWKSLAEQAGGLGLGPSASDIQRARELQCGADLQLEAMNAFLHEALD